MKALKHQVTWSVMALLLVGALPLGCKSEGAGGDSSTTVGGAGGGAGEATSLGGSSGEASSGGSSSGSSSTGSSSTGSSSTGSSSTGSSSTSSGTSASVGSATGGGGSVNSGGSTAGGTGGVSGGAGTAGDCPAGTDSGATGDGGGAGGACDGCSWGEAVRISNHNDDDTDRNPTIAMNEAGAAVVAWNAYDEGDDEVWVNFYTPDQGWSGPELLVERPASYAAVGIDDEGNAFVLWLNASAELWSTRYLVGFGWEVAEPMNTDRASQAQEPLLAVAPDGSALAVWRDYDAGHWTIQSKRYVPGEGWGSSVPIPLANEYPEELRIAANPSGDAVVLWRQQVRDYGAAEHTIWSSRTAAGSDWSVPESLSSIVGFSQPYEPDLIAPVTYYYEDSFPEVVVDAWGNSIAVWNQYNDDRWQVWVNRLDASTGWEGAQLLSDTPHFAMHPEVGVDAEGNAVSMWRQTGGCQARHYGLESGWGDAELLPDHCVILAVGSAGHAVVGTWWAQAIRYSPDIGWGDPEITDAHGYYSSQDVAVDADGTAILVWEGDARSPGCDEYPHAIWASISPAPQ